MCAVFNCLFLIAEKKTIIEVESAEKSHFSNKSFSISGNSAVSIREEGNDKKIYVTATYIKFDREKNMLYAWGNVNVETKRNDKTEESILTRSFMLNTSTLEGVSEDGSIVKFLDSSDKTLNVSELSISSELFAGSSATAVVFKNGRLTTSKRKNPYWHVKASRIWLLPNGELAFVNAFFYVGEVPLLYLPAFYYPKDELIFNPVFSFSPERGYSLNTTTYILGRKSPDENGNAIFSMQQEMKQYRRGIMLHNTDEADDTSGANFLKIMGDYYTMLGYNAGLGGRYASTLIETSGEFHIAASNTVFETPLFYSPYSQDGKKIYDHSYLFKADLPFRFAWDFSFKLKRPFSLNIKTPMYSDPFFKKDFLKRSEHMNWFTFFAKKDEKKEFNSYETSFKWKADASYSVPKNKLPTPYMKNVDISFSSFLDFYSTSTKEFPVKRADGYSRYEWERNTPERKFYFPREFSPGEIKIKTVGNLLHYEDGKWQKKEKSTLEKEKNEIEEKIQLKPPADFIDEETQKQTEEKDKDSEKFMPFPELETKKTAAREIPSLIYDLNYEISGEFQTQGSYSSDGLKNAKDFDFNKFRSIMFYLKTPLKIENKLKYGGEFFSATHAFTFDFAMQRHTAFLRDTKQGGFSEKNILEIKKNDYENETRAIKSDFSLTFKPFYYIPLVSNTRLSYRLSCDILRMKFNGNAQNPAWTPAFVSFSKNKKEKKPTVSTHEAEALIEFREKEGAFSQSLRLESKLPPVNESYLATLSFAFPTTEVKFSSGIKKNIDEKWEKEDFTESVNISLLKNELKFTQTYKHSLEKKRAEQLRFSAAWKGLYADVNFLTTKGYTFSQAAGYTVKNNEEFLLKSVDFTYSPSSLKFYAWKNRISFSLGGTIKTSFNAIKQTQSYFVFAPEIEFAIHENLKISLKSESRNSVIYRYFGNQYGLPGETNFFVDLMNSFRFDNESLRRKSGFKIKNFSLKIERDLVDWLLSCELKISPRIIHSNGRKQFDFKPYFSLSIVWKPVSRFKTRVVDEYGTWKIN